MAWCPQDPDLLLSCGKDNRILCWNPNTQAQQGEVRTQYSWLFLRCMLLSRRESFPCTCVWWE